MTLASLIVGLYCAFNLSFGVTNGCEKYLHVPKVHTPIDEITLHETLKEAHIKILGREPHPNRISMAWAQIAFENGRGAKVYNHNLGNIGGHPIKPRRPYYTVNGYRFRSMSNFLEGAKAYWKIMIKMCSGALPAFDAGDPITASYVLYRCGYYRAPVEHYTSNLSCLFYEKQKKIK